MAAGLDAALAAAKMRATEALVELRRWVEINSYTRNVDGVNEVADQLAASFDRLGMTLTRHAGNGVGDHLVWHTAGWERARGGRVLLIGHHDTVFPPGAFEGWRADGDRITGPGVLDMKGGLAVIWAALSALADTGHLARLPVALITVGDEEIGSADSRPILEQLARDASAALVFESGRPGDEIITRRKGVGSLTLVATGRAAHAGSNHREGINAIRATGRFVDAVEAMTDYASEVTVNVGMIRGGEARNTAPAFAQCDIDIRFPTADVGRALVDRIHALADRVAGETGASLAITGGISRQPLERSDASAALCQRYAACARASGLGGGEASLIGGGSDANTVSFVGTPAIDGLGPRGRGFHTHDEYIEVPTLGLRAQALVRFLLGYQLEADV